MLVFEQIFIGLITTAVGIFIGWSWNHAFILMKTRNARRFWKPFIEEPSKLVLGTFSEFKSFEPSGFIGLGDTMALAELERYFGETGFEELNILYTDQVKGDDVKNNLILLGGPDANCVTNNAINLLKPSIRSGNPEQYEVAIVDLKTNKCFVPVPYGKEQSIGKDYGVIVVSDNPFDPKKRIIIAYGSFGYGTWAAARFLISDNFFKLIDKNRLKNFEILIEVDVVLKTPQNIRVIETRKLT